MFSPSTVSSFDRSWFILSLLYVHKDKFMKADTSQLYSNTHVVKTFPGSTNYDINIVSSGLVEIWQIIS